jgi:peptidase C39-like protein
MRMLFAVAIAAALVMSSTGMTAAAKTPGTPLVQFMRANLTGGSASGLMQTGGVLTLASSGLSAGSYDDPYDKDRGAIAYQSGSWISDWAKVEPFDELVASWNADTPAGTWISIEMQASGPDRADPTKWYLMGIWASGDADIHRTSRGGQGDLDGFVAIDTFIRDKQALPLDLYQLRVTLYRASGTATPRVRMVGAMTSAATAYDIPSAFGGRARDLVVPRYSQEIHRDEFSQYDNGGEAWCSPTSTAMVLAFWRKGPSNSDLKAFPGAGYTDPQVDYAARYIYDWHYTGTGNWPFNTAYAARFGLDAFVTRLRSLGEAEMFINAGIPLVASIQGNLPGFFFKKTNGHLLVIRGFTATGDVIANDPAVPTDRDVTKVYGRADFESVWLGGSAGIVYVIYPAGHALPANVPGLPANW